MFLPIIRRTWLYLQYLVVFTQVAAGWCLGWVESELCELWIVNTTRYCNYSQVLLMMGKNIARNMQSWLGIINWPVQLHLVGYFHNCCHDARIHKCQVHKQLPISMSVYSSIQKLQIQGTYPTLHVSGDVFVHH